LLILDEADEEVDDEVEVVVDEVEVDEVMILTDLLKLVVVINLNELRM
jgi:hypothetical protein